VAKVVNHIPRSQNTNYRYNWDDWLNGETWELEQLVDFTCTAEGIISAARQAAGRRGGVVSAAIVDGKVYICFTKRTETK
jgi:hypothetical protein